MPQAREGGRLWGAEGDCRIQREGTSLVGEVVIVPFYAMSCETLIALAADEIIMEPDSVLGAVDPQSGGWPAGALVHLGEEACRGECGSGPGRPILGWHRARTGCESHHGTRICREADFSQRGTGLERCLSLDGWLRSDMMAMPMGGMGMTPNRTGGEDMESERLELEVRGMTCESCALHVEKALATAPGVKEVSVPGWKSARATVVAEGEVTADDLAAAVKGSGYTVAVRSRKPVRQAADRAASGDEAFDLMILGAGSAGFAAAIKAAELGRRVALVGSGIIGGTCVNVGCIPSKTLIRAVEMSHLAGQARFRGVHTVSGRISWAEVMAHKDELVNQLRQEKYIDVLSAYPEITYIEGHARLTGGNGVEVDGRVYAPGKIVIATGAQPWAPPIPGLAEAGYLDSTSALELRELPKSMIVLGGNAVGLELAQTYARAGTYVTVLEVLPRVLPFEDEEISAALTGYLEAEGMRIVPGFRTDGVVRRDGRYELFGLKNEAEVVFEAEQLLVATGRRANTAGMGLEEAGVRLGPRGEVLVNDLLQTHNPLVYAAGDVTARDMFVYVASYAGKLAADNALTGAGKVYDASTIPRITFTDPQVASAGLTEAEARAQGRDVRTSVVTMAHVPRAQAARDTRGMVKLIADAQTDHLIGAHILAPEAGEMIQTAVLAIRFGIRVGELRETMFPYLTNAEGLKLAALAFEKDITKLSCCAG